MIHAADDPVVSDGSVDWDAVVQRNKNIISVTTQRGGHVGWYDSPLIMGPTWADRMVGNFLSATLETQAQTNFLTSVLRRALREAPEGQDVLRPHHMARICSQSDLAAVTSGSERGDAAASDNDDGDAEELGRGPAR